MVWQHENQFSRQNQEDILLDFISCSIVSSTDSVKRIIDFHFGCIRLWQVFRQAADFIGYALLISFWYFLQRFCRRPLDLNTIIQSSSSFFNSSQGVGSPGSFFAFHASSMSIWSSISCRSLSSFKETRAAIGSLLRVKTNGHIARAL